MKTVSRDAADRMVAWLAITTLSVLAALSNTQPAAGAIPSSSANSANSSAIFVPVLLTASGRNNSLFISELTLTNRGTEEATLHYTYTAHSGGGSGTATDRLAPGHQRIQTDAIGYLTNLGIPIPGSGNRIGTLRVEVADSSEVGVTVRTTTRVAHGRAGLAYPGIAAAAGFEEAVYLCGLRQNRQDRSNVALQNMGTPDRGNITLRTTVYSGDADNRTSHVLPDLILPPGGFHQYNGILNLAGFDNGYVTVERVEGPSPFYAYGVINDQVNSDGSFVFPVTASSLSGAREQTLPVIIEHSNFSSELIVTNFSSSTKELKFSFVADAVQNSRRTALFFLTLGAGEQRIIPEIVEHLRRQEVDGIGPAGRTLAGAVFAAEASGDMSGVVIGARTGSPGGGGQYSVFYNAVPNGAAFSDRAWIDALQQNGENRSNLALVNTGEADGGSSVFEIEIYDGDTGGLVNTVGGIGVPARGWHQINRILRDYAPGITQGYVRVRKTAGNNPFLAYGVINDGGAPGQRSGDGAYLPSAARVIAPKPDPAVDREALEALYNAIGGPRWSDRTNWLSQVPLGDWYGVGTDGSGRVISLDLSFNQLSGPIPPELSALSNLQRLSLEGNQLSGPIPPELSALSNLKLLSLEANQLSGPIPAELSALSNLQWLHLGANQLSGPIPPELSALSNLQSLSLAFNQLSGSIPAELSALSSLQWLSLQINQLSGSIPAELSTLSNLQRLSLWANQLSGPIPAELSALSNLQSLSLAFNQLSGPVPAELSALSSLESLDLEGNQLSGPVPSELSALSNLQRLSLWANQLSGPIPAELSALSNLQSLSLAFNQLSGPVPAELSALSKLESLDLEGNQLRGPIPAELSALSKLQRLSLEGNRLSGPIPPDLPALTNLQWLFLGFNPDLTGTLPPELQQLPLSTLDLMATSVCVPDDAELRRWLATIDFFLPSGLMCGRPAETVPSIDVALFFTPAARRRAGGKAEIEASTDLMIAETNRAYEDSGVNQRVRLVARKEVSYEEEAGSGGLALHRLEVRSDGYMDEVHEIRDRAGADLVHLIADVTDLGGIANLPGGFGVTCAECDAIVFAHELGHNMGLSHDRYLDRGLLPFSHGYVNQQAFADGAPDSSRWRTIMSYPNQCSDRVFDCDWILRFSNPNQTWLGDPLGVPGSNRTAAVSGPADASRLLNITRHSVSSFRPQSSGNQPTISSAPSPSPSMVGADQAPAPIPGGGLFQAIAPNTAGAGLHRAVSALDRNPVRWRQVSVDIGRLVRVPDDRPTALSLNLFDDLVLTGIIDRRTQTYSGGYALSGSLAGVPGGNVTLVVNGSVVAGAVRLPGATYRIRPTGRGSHAVVQIDPAQSAWRCGTGR